MSILFSGECEICGEDGIYHAPHREPGGRWLCSTCRKTLDKDNKAAQDKSE